MIDLCVTADDYGLSPDVNAGIHALAARGAVSAASVMVHRDAVLDDAGMLRDDVATGVHLVLVGERPLLPDRLAPLLDGDGFLPLSYGQLFLALARDRTILPRLGDEIAAQIARFRALGLPLDFVNSHQHVHLLPVIWTQVLRALADFDGLAPMLRVAHRAPHGGLRQTLLRVSSRLAWMRHPLSESAVLTAVGVDFAGHTTLRDVDAVLGRINRTKISGAQVRYELVMHPGFEEHPPAVRHAQWRYRWRSEYDLLSSPDFGALLQRYGTIVARPTSGPRIPGAR